MNLIIHALASPVTCYHYLIELIHAPSPDDVTLVGSFEQYLMFHSAPAALKLLVAVSVPIEPPSTNLSHGI